jgi:hypothetical protein
VTAIHRRARRRFRGPGGRPARGPVTLGLVYPMENAAIALLLVVAIAVLFWRLAARGPSRMARALYTLAAVVLVLWLFGLVVSVIQRPGG